MARNMLATLAVTVFTAAVGSSGLLHGQAGSTTPDFSGVYSRLKNGVGRNLLAAHGQASCPRMDRKVAYPVRRC